MKFLKEYSAIVSAIAALIAIIFSINIHIQTRRLMKKFERPIICLVKETTSGKLNKEESKLNIAISFQFKNIGRYPAENLRLKSGLAPKTSPHLFRKISERTIANTIDPDTEFNYHLFLDYPLKKEELKQAKIKKSDWYIYVFMDYKDEYNPDKNYTEEFWFTYTMGKTFTDLATTQDRKALEVYVYEAFPKKEQNN